MNAQKIANQIAKNMVALFSGYYASAPSTQVPPPSEETVAKLILPELNEVKDRPKFDCIGTTIYEQGTTLVVYNAPSEEQAQEIVDALNTYGE
jgi:hypothetical protein